MRSSLALSIVGPAVLTLTSAYDFSQWSPAGPGDARSPCPMLNSFANHNFFPHSGRGLSASLVAKVIEEVLNFGADITLPLAVGALSTSSNPLSLTFDLDNLNKHNDIEHDASLGHNDFTFDGNARTFNQTLFDTYLASFSGMDKANLTQAAKGRLMRVNTEAERDPNFTYGPKQLFLSYGESALVLSALGDPLTGAAPISWLQTLWADERLPYAEGWRPNTQQANASTLFPMMLKLVAASGDVLPEGLLATANTVKRAFAGLDLFGSQPTGLQKQLLKLLGLDL